MRAGKYLLTRQVVSMPAPAGETLSHSHSVVATNGRQLSGPGAFQSNERAIPSLCEEFRVDERPKQRIADVTLETPQALCLRRRQPKSRHFYELALDPLKHVVDAHRARLRGFPDIHSYSEEYKSKLCTASVELGSELDCSGGKFLKSGDLSEDVHR